MSELETIKLSDIIKLFDTLRADITRAVENSAAAKETAALAVRKVIDLENAFSDFRNDTLIYREVRAELDRQDALQQLEAAQKKLTSSPSSPNPSTQERIEKYVKMEVNKGKIDWPDLWKNKIVPALAVLTATTVWGAILWAFVTQIILPAFSHLAGN